MISAPGRRVYTVSALTTEVKAVLEDSFPAIWVEGEISTSNTTPPATCTSR